MSPFRSERKRGEAKGGLLGYVRRQKGIQISESQGSLWLLDTVRMGIIKGGDIQAGEAHSGLGSRVGGWSEQDTPLNLC